MLITLDQFRGMLPRYGNRVIPKTHAEFAWNAKVWSGELRCVGEDKSVRVLPALPAGARYKGLFKYDISSIESRWLAWTADVDLAPGPVSNDINNRIYLTGLGGLRAFDKTMLSDSDTTITPANSISVGVTAPAEPLLAVTGTSGGEEVSRTYVVTYVREWSDGKQDESAPSPVAKTAGGETTVDVGIGQTVTVSNLTPSAATDEGNIKLIRVYRSAITSSGVGSYRFVYEFEADPSEVASYPKVAWDGTKFTFTDDVKDEDLREELPSSDWDKPIDGLKGLVSLKNGVFAAFDGNDIYFSEPYYPHAWPTKFKMTLDYKIVGLGSFGNNVVVCTEAYPHVINAKNPDAAIAVPVSEVAPCISKRSIINTNGSVVYATPQGLLSIDSAVPKLVTQDLYTRDEWMALNPETIRAAYHQGQYVAFFDKADGTPGGVIIDLAEQEPGVTLISGFAGALHVDASTDTLYKTAPVQGQGHAVFQFEGEPYLKKMAIWKSKELTSAEGIANFAAARVDIVSNEQHVSIDMSRDLLGAFNETPVNELPLAGDVYSWMRSRRTSPELTVFSLYVDGKLVYTKVVNNSLPFRLPAGVRGSSYQIMLETNRDIKRVEVATSMAELS